MPPTRAATGGLTCRKEQPDPSSSTNTGRRDRHAGSFSGSRGGYCEPGAPHVVLSRRQLDTGRSTRSTVSGSPARWASRLVISPSPPADPRIKRGGVDDLSSSPGLLEEGCVNRISRWHQWDPVTKVSQNSALSRLAATRLQTDGSCQVSTSRWYCFQTRSCSGHSTMSAFHVVILAMVLICLEVLQTLC